MTSISIIIPTLNEQDYLPNLLQSIIDQSYKDEYEVIIVDGNSEDKTGDVAITYKELMPNLSFYASKKGISTQRNYGVSKAKYKNIIFIDADMQLPKNVLQKVAAYFNKYTDFIAIPHLLPYDGKPIDTLFAQLGNFYIWLNRKNAPIACGMCLITTKHTHHKLGGFDETLEYAEDIDYSLRGKRKGIPYYIFSDVTVKSSTRRLQVTTRIKLARTWLSWHIGAIRNGARSLQDKSDYRYGNFNRK